jgi:hypothetical protein
MGLFPFASTIGIGTMSPPIPATASMRMSRRPWRTSSHNFASCFGTARCPDAVARPARIRGGVARPRSGGTLSRSVRGDRSGAERGPPSGP